MRRKKNRKIKRKRSRRSEKIRKKVKKRILKINLSKIKALKISKQINQLKEMNLLIKRKGSRAINKQINRIMGISLRKSASHISQSLNKAYEDFKKRRKIEKLKKIKLEKREKARRI